MLPPVRPPITDAELALGASIAGLEAALRRLRDGLGLEADDPDVVAIAESLSMARETRDAMRRLRGG